jgi:hypothetical protein
MSDALLNTLLTTDPEDIDVSDNPAMVPTDEEIRLSMENNPLNDTETQDPIPPEQTTPEIVLPQPTADQTLPPDQVPPADEAAQTEEAALGGVEEPKSTLGAVTATAANALDVAVPSVVAMGAFPLGAAAVGLVSAPTGPVAIGAAFAGGLASAGGAYWATDKAQNMAFEYVAPESYKEWQGYLKKAQEQYPVSSGIGQIVPNAVAMRPSFSVLKDSVSFSRQLLSKSNSVAKELTTAIGKERIENLANVVFGAGTELAAETIRQATEDGNFDFLRLAAMTLAGAMMNKPTEFGKKLTKIGGFNSKEVAVDPTTTDADGELARALMRQLEGEEDFDPIPNPIGEKYSSLEDFIKGDFSGTSMADDKSVIEVLRLQAKTVQAEKTSDPASWTPQERAAYNQGDYKTFSKLRGYTEEEIADFEKYQQLKQELINKYGDEITNSFDHPDVSEFVYDVEFGAGAYAKKQERLLDRANPDKSPVSGESAAPSRISEATKEQNKQAAIQLGEFAKLISEESGDITEKAIEAGTLNIELLNATITRDPEEALKALAIALKDLKVPRLTAEKRAQKAISWLEEHGYEERVAALQISAKTSEELNYQIIAARYMTENAINALTKAEQKVRETNSEEALAEAVSIFLEVKRVLKPAEKIRGNWGRMGHAFRNLDPKYRNIAALNKMLKDEGIDDLGKVTKEKASQLMHLISMALKNKNPRQFSKIINMSGIDIITGALGEALTGAVMSPTDTSIVNIVGGVGETLLTPISGTLSSSYGLVKASILKLRGKEADEDITRELATLESSLTYLRYIGKRFDCNMRAFLSILQDSEIKFGSAASKLEDIRGGVPIDRGERISEPNSWGTKIGKLAYGKLGKFRTQGYLTSETAEIAAKKMGFDLNPDKHPMVCLLVDAVGETFRSVHRTILAADDFFKASNAYAAAHSKLHIEGRVQGLKGKDLEKYINERLDLLIDKNNRLYTEERVRDEVSKEVAEEGLEGAEAASEVLKRTDERFNSEVGELAKFADDWAKKVTYQSELGNRLTGKNTIGKTIQEALQKHPFIRLGLGFLFVNTPINIFRATGRLIPTAALLEKVASIKLKGGAQPFTALRNIQKDYSEAYASGDPFRIAQARGRQLAGVAVTSMGLGFAAKDITTGGGPKNKESRKLWLSKGNIPYAIKIPKDFWIGRWIKEEIKNNPKAIPPDGETQEHYFFEYKRLHEPTAAFFMAAADVIEYMKHPEYDERNAADLVGILSLVAGTQLTEKVFLNNIKQWSDLFKGISEDQRDIGRKLTTYLGRRSASLFVPVSESTDPVIYDLSTFSQQIARRMPSGLRGVVFGKDMYLPKAYNILGEDIDAAITGISLIDAVLPFYVSSSKIDPLIDELVSLNYNFSSPEKFYGTEDGKGWDIRNFAYKGGAFTKLAADSDEIREFSEEKFLESLKINSLEKNEADLGSLYKDYGIKTLPKLGQDAYDRWQENIGQIKIEGVSLRDALGMVIKSEGYQSLENQILKGEENPRAQFLMKYISEYRTAALELTKEEYPELRRSSLIKKITNQALKSGVKREGLKGIRKEIEDALDFPN